MKADYPSVLLIYTGGTIGMIENPETGALENFNFDHLLKHVPELKRFNYRISSYQFDPPIDSSDMEPAFWAKLVEIINYNYDSFDGFVILHGTDTMAYTASALSFMLENLSKPVILTGSQLPIGTLRTDGKENLITAIEIAAAKNPDSTAIVPEVCIFFENHLMRGNRTTKINAENFNAFRSFNYPPLARVGIHIKYEPNLIRKPDLSKPLKPHYLFDTHAFPRNTRGHCFGTASCTGTQSSGTQNFRIGECSPKGVVHQRTERCHRPGNHHCQHHPMRFRRRRNGTLRNRNPITTGRGDQRL